jgi:hypothetical protein
MEGKFEGMPEAFIHVPVVRTAALTSHIFKNFTRFDLPNRRSAPQPKPASHPFLAFQPRRLDEQAADWFAAGAFRFSQGSQFGELRTMLYIIRLEIYCCLNVTEIGIVAWPRRTDVASGKKVTVPQPKDERFYWLTSD